MNRKKYCIANWKMNFSSDEIHDYINKWNEKNVNNDVQSIICPPFTYLSKVSKLLINNTENCAQNIFFANSGSYTGEISPSMIKDCGCNWVMIGHSERREIFNESNEIINKKLIFSLKENLNAILCVGESKSDRIKGNTEQVINEQLLSAFKNINLNDENAMIIAYEPVWAIGTGITADIDKIKKAHEYIRNFIIKKGFKNKNISIIYGGSVTAKNADEICRIDNVDGFLVGGASLIVESFYEIYNKLQES